MISAIVFVSDANRREASRERELLVRSLVWLVSAVVAGIVHDVTLTGPAELGLSDVADQSGCNVVEGRCERVCLPAAAALTKYPRLLILKSGFQPMEGMIGELDHVGRVLAENKSARLLAAPSNVWQRVFPDRAPTVGLFAPSARCRALSDFDFRSLKATLKPRTLFAGRFSPIA